MEAKGKIFSYICVMKKFLLTFLWLLPATAFAQTHLFTLDSDFMARGELRVGGNAASNTSAEGDFAAFILGRARLAAHYQLQLKDAAPRLEVRMAAIRFLEFRR